MQFLLHHWLHSIPLQLILCKTHTEWVAAAECHKKILHHSNAKIVERYHKYTHNFPPLQAGDTVAIQSPLKHRWNRTRKIITVLLDCQYQIRVNGSGRITLRNHHFLRKCILKSTPTPITPTSNAPLLHSYSPTSSSNGTHTAIEPPKQATYTSPHLWLLRIPWALSRLLPYNRSGLKEGYSPHTNRYY